MWTDYTKSEDICTSDFLNRVEGYHLPVVIYGIGAYASCLAENLTRRGVKIEAFTVDKPFYKSGMQFCGYTVLPLDDAKVSWGGTHVFVIGMWGPMVLRLIKEHTENPDGIRHLEADTECPPTHYIPDWKFWDDFLQNSIAKDVLLLQENKESFKKEVFSRFVFVVNLELSTYCNRKCSYCPMSFFPREQEFMPMDLLNQILSQLKEIHYAGAIMLNFYNEPLLDSHLADKIRIIREQLPHVWIAFNSNGD